MKKLFLIDAYALIFRYYYALLSRPMRNNEGMNTSVVFGFTKFLREIIKREKPDLLGVAFDPPGGSFRKELYPAYKANRSETPEDIIISVPYVKRLLEAMCIPILEVKGYEADDVIGTLSRKGVEAGYEVFMVTPDKDYGQLVNEHSSIYKQTGADGIEVIGREKICQKYGIEDPALVRDILALWGDASDNIPGVPGVGEVRATKLVREWGTVEQIIENCDKIGGKLGVQIAESKELIIKSKELTTICLDVPIELDPSALTICKADTEKLKELYTELNFKALLSELGGDTTATPKATKPAPTNVNSVPDLFSSIETTEPAPPTEEPIQEQMATAQSTEHTYTMIRGCEKLQEIVDQISAHTEFCFDTETTGLDFLNNKVIGISLAIEPHKAWYVPFNGALDEEYSKILRPLFANENIAKVGQNIKFDILMLQQYGIEVRGRLFDTMILHYLLDPESRHNMTALAERYLNYSPIEITTLIGAKGRGSKQITMDMVPPEKVTEYAAEDADITLQLKHKLWAQIQEQGFEELYSTIEEPLIMVLAQMESEGVRVDAQVLHNYAVELNEKLIKLETQIREIADEPSLNINSARQLGEVLFGKLQLAAKPKMTKTKQYSTDEEYLQGFAGKHEIVDLVLEYRGVKKLVSTYVEALPKLINDKSRRIHTSYNQAVTATGRLSSTNPNLQNIPIRDKMGRYIRKAFVPADGDHTLLSADYSQVELRVMAHLSGDQALIEAFANGEDIHSATAARLFGKSLNEVTSDERRKAKTANFGIIYGISAFGLSQRLDIPQSEAKEIIGGYFRSYPAVREYMDSVVEQAKQTGYVETIFGRRRYLNDINSRNAIARSLAERNAINAPIQGSAADVMKLAMIHISQRFKTEGIKSKMILQVHDEVVIDTLKSELERVQSIVTDAMQSAVELKVKLLAESGTGENWLEAH